MFRPASISKTLTANDVGDTGGHQAGILVPKAPEILAFFPRLIGSEKNPRLPLTFRDSSDQTTRWEFVFIYYNNRFFGGTRNEYRLTRMTKYLRSSNAKVSDTLVLSRDSEGRLFVKCIRSEPMVADEGVLRLTGGWKVIPI
ncbi:MAG: hypothetical protein JSR36_15385 [Proteobacteria bacterium]|nr:hypothetical protein [Pseudomonadota bacterium]